MMPDSAPLMRVSYMRETVAAIGALGARADAVRARCSTEIARIEGASRLSFLPVTDNLALLKAVEEIGGAAALRAQGRIAFVAAASGPLLRPIRDTALKMLGATPAGIFRWAPQTWKLVFRNTGVLSWQPTSGGGSLILEHLPPLLDCTAWAETSAGAFEGGFDLAGNASGTVTIERAPSTFRFRLQWTTTPT